MKFQLFLTFCLTLAGTYGEISNSLDVDGLKDKLSEQIPNADLENIDTSDIQKVLEENNVNLGGIDASKLPQADELDIIFRSKCDGKSGNGTYDNVKVAKDKYQECLSNFVNITQLQEELEEAKKTGSMDEVFGKYCDKYPELQQCSDEFVEAIKPCLEESELNSLNMSLSLTKKLKEFVCYKNGDRIAMFVAEGGVDCIQSQKQALQDCLNSTLSSRIPSDVTPNSLPVLMFDAKDCTDFQKLRTCVAEALGKCEETTPANLVDAFFKYLKKILPCSVQVAEAQTSKESSGFSIAPISAFILVSSALLVRLL